MAESFDSRLMRWKFNLFPAYRGSGGRVDYISADYREVRVSITLNWRTYNYVGTMFGGSLYSVIDPIYMIMLLKILGSDYVVWDRAATIRFLKPGKSRLTGTFTLSDEQICEIREAAEKEKSLDRTFTIELVDAEGVPHVSVDKVLYVRKKRARVSP